METTTIASWGSFVLAVPQGAVAIVQLANFRKGAKMPTSFMRQIMAALLVCGVALSVGLGVWIKDHPQQPKVVTVEKIVEKSIPCPPAKSGAATTKGTQSPANSGSNNQTTYGTGASPVQKTPPN